MWLLKRFARWVLRDEIQRSVNSLVKLQRGLEQFHQEHYPTFNFPGSGNKPKDKTLKRSVLPSTGASKSSGCSRGRSRGEEDYPEAFFPWREW